MKLAKQYNFKRLNLKDEKEITNYLKVIDSDLANVILCLQGRVRFGTGEDGTDGENIYGEFQVFTTSATPDAENTIAHTLGAVPIGHLVVKQDKAGSLYSGTTTWSSTNIYLKSNVASVTFTVFLLK